MRPALSVQQRTCEVVKGKVDRNMELQGKEIQIEETIHQRNHVTAWHVRADCPSGVTEHPGEWLGRAAVGLERRRPPGVIKTSPTL